MFDSGHFCLLVFAQGSWKEGYKNRLRKKISTDFLELLEPKSEEEAKQISWNEIDKSPLFDPKLEHECRVCENLYKLFDAKKGANEGLIYFSHNVPDIEGFKTFFTHLFGEETIKKVYYLELATGSK